MKYYKIMEGFHTRVAEIYRHANKNNLSSNHTTALIDTALADTMETLRKRRAPVAENGTFCTIKALIV